MSGDGPVVLGSGVTGLLVSASLSKAGIAHTLLGGPPPDDRPRLGESMNEGSSALMWRLFGFDATPHLYMKSHISLVHGELASLAYAANPRRTVPGVQRVARGLDLPLTGLGPSIAMLPSPQQAMIAFAEVSSFIDFWVARAGDRALPKLLEAIRDAPPGGDAVVSALVARGGCPAQHRLAPGQRRKAPLLPGQ